MTVGVDYGFGLSVTPLIAIDGDRLDITLGLQALDGSRLPSGTSMRLTVIVSGDIDGISSHSILANVTDRAYERSYTLRVGESGGSISVAVPSCFYRR